MGLPRAKRRFPLLFGILFSLFILLAPQLVFATNVTFTYDAAGRLLSAQYSDGQKVAYTYDTVGNMTQQVVKGESGGSGLVPILPLLLDDDQLGNPARGTAFNR